VVAQIGATLAVLYGLGTLVGGILLVVDFIHDRSRFDNSLVIFTSLGAALMVAVMIFGGVQLWRQDETGRYTLIVASGVSLAIGIVGLAVSLTDYEFGLGIFWWSTADHPLWVVPFFGLAPHRNRSRPTPPDPPFGSQPVHRPLDRRPLGPPGLDVLTATAFIMTSADTGWRHRAGCQMRRTGADYANRRAV
jgi:hypothetical protein